MQTEALGGAEKYQIDYFKSINYEKYSVFFGVNVDIFNESFRKNWYGET
jgi:hypothetical protein